VARSLAIKDEHAEQRIFRARALIVSLVAIALMGVLVLRMVQLQVWKHDFYQTRSDNNRIQIQPMAPPRGLIYDRNGVLLADNRPVFSLEIVRERVGDSAEDLDRFIEEIRAVVPVSDNEVAEFEKRLKRRRRPFEPVALKGSLTEEEIAVLAVDRYRFPGMEINAQLARHYPFGELFAHSVGSVRRINEEDLRKLDPVVYSGTRYMGKRGVEQYYETSLHGEVGYQHVETDAHGRIRQVLDILPPVSGQNISLSLDSRLQIAASGALGDRRGAIVALDVRSGGILAMVSHPGYDPNLFVGGISPADYRHLITSRDTPLFNRAVNGQYAPGSTFKPIMGLAGIVHGQTNWERQVEDHGWFRLPEQERIYRDWSWKKDNSGGQGVVDLHRAIYRSSNVYFYDLASKLTIQQIDDFAAQFGIGQVTSVDVASASPGLLPDPVWKRRMKGEAWYPGDNVNMGIGQGDLLVTPLQLATAANVIANRGRWVRPSLLLASDGQLVELVENEPSPPIPDVSGPTPDDWERIVDAMEAVVHRNKGYQQDGTAWAYIGRDIGYRMAGKSGTAQVVEIRQGEEYGEEELDEYNRNHAWFIAFAPADDPSIAVCVLVENGGGGSSVAGPVAREVIDAYLLPQLAAR
jgi:penicillin-binding protein 2|tara:strand:- start:416 stop:2320 length:1905 start_codon:yes stop_codon:yes gene_type:complete